MPTRSFPGTFTRHKRLPCPLCGSSVYGETDVAGELLKAAKIGLGYVVATESSLPTKPNIVSKDADFMREAIVKAENQV
jgi:hypothetical protein